MKKTALALTVILLVLASALVIGYGNVAKGNPSPYSDSPNMEEPTLTIWKPGNYTEYKANGSIELFFRVTQPDSWNSTFSFNLGPGSPIYYDVGWTDSVDVYLDEISIVQYQAPIDPMVKNYSDFSHSFNVSSVGVHLLNVTVVGYTYYTNPTYGGDWPIVSGTIPGGEPLYKYPRIVSNMVSFTVVGEQSTPTPAPTATPEATSQPATLPASLVFVASVGIALAVIGSLVYLKRYKSGKNVSVKNS